ncbi:aldolase/citrate lyase family protein [Bacteroidota bacterium]
MDLILITSNPDVAKYAEECHINTIMVDLEIIGKKERQGHLSTVISEHSLDDVSKIRNVISKSNLLVRANPIHENSKFEIDKIIECGADIVMLPMFTSAQEVKTFISYINGRARINLLLETPQALVRIDEILSIKGIDEIHIGLNDLHLSMGLIFMFELLSSGIVEYLSKKINSASIKFGFGGIARLGQGTLDSSLILSEHHRLNSKMVILSRDFHGNYDNLVELRNALNLEIEVRKINQYLNKLNSFSDYQLNINQRYLKEKVNEIIRRL